MVALKRDPMNYPMTAKATKSKTKLCTVEGCDRDHYAKGMCFKHWRADKGYGPGGDRVKANAKYDDSEQGRERHKRAYQKRQVVRRLTGVKSITAAFKDADAIAKMQASRHVLEPILDLFTEEQLAILQNGDDEN